MEWYGRRAERQKRSQAFREERETGACQAGAMSAGVSVPPGKREIFTFPALRFSISYTTRPRRATEVHGRDYFFVARDEFDRMVVLFSMLDGPKEIACAISTSATTAQ